MRWLGVVGCGAVGRSAVKVLASYGRVRVGTRKTGRTKSLIEEGTAAVEWMALDVQDPESLRSFCADCSIVINCAGPAAMIGSAIARAAFAASADYVDASGHAEWQLGANGRRAILAAGMYPGLSGLLPRWLASQSPGRMTRLTAYVGGCDRLSLIAALDYLDSFTDGSGKLNAAWLSGGPTVLPAQPATKACLPFFPRPVVVQPYLTAETERLASTLGLREVKWYSVFDGEHAIAVLPVAAARRDADMLVRAAELDLFGREPYQLMLFEMAGLMDNKPVWRSLMLKAAGAAALTGSAAAIAAISVAEGIIPQGVHYFAEVMDPIWTVQALQPTGALRALEVFEEPLEWAERGVI